jgi:NhaP-type Na+/H+ and K+/H+ antiporter
VRHSLKPLAVHMLLLQYLQDKLVAMWLNVRASVSVVPAVLAGMAGEPELHDSARRAGSILFDDDKSLRY